MTKNVLFYARHSAGYHDHACLETQLYYGHRFIEENGWTFVKCGFHKVRDTDFSKSRTAISVSAGQ
ncbi:hypothetical protein [Agrobacterium salinitolerans]|uniref:hypothetical protein n=1 Tax=Agrobacterium salinitolerans TaxID=1183413 RepID=UPI0035B3F999